MRNKGFTLIELLVVIAIVGFLAAIMLVILNSARIAGRDARRKTDVDVLRKAVTIYYQDNGIYPATANGSSSGPYGSVAGWSYTGVNDWLFAQGLVPQYIQSVPRDPYCPSGSSCNYQYAYNTTQTEYAILVLFEGIPQCKFMSAGGNPALFNNAPSCNY